MERLCVLSLLVLASCQSFGWSDTADLLLPDEFQVGEGSSSINTVGGYQGHQHMYEYEGEGESTYAALTWHLPSVKSDNGMSRETQRNLALLIDHMVEEEGIDTANEGSEEDAQTETLVDAGPLSLNLREGVDPPPLWLGGVVLAIFVLLGLKLRSSTNRRRNWS